MSEEKKRYTARQMRHEASECYDSLLSSMLRQAADTEEKYLALLKDESKRSRSNEEAEEFVLTRINTVCEEELDRLERVMYSLVSGEGEQEIAQKAIDSIIRIKNYVSGYESEKNTIGTLHNRLDHVIEQLELWSNSLGEKIGFFNANIQEGCQEVFSIYKRLTGQKEAIDELIKIAKGEIVVHHGDSTEDS